MDTSFEVWLEKLRELSIELFGAPYITGCSWNEFYKEGYTPREALNEDLNNG